MKLTRLSLKDAYRLDLAPIEDERGFFARSFSLDELRSHGWDFRLVQADISFSRRKGTLRGMHFQLQPHAQAKIVRCTRGALFDVLIDIRPGSPTFKKWEGVTLTPDNRTSLLIPEGFAHGFITLEDDTEIHYLVTKDYKPSHYRALRWDDPEIDVKWPYRPQVISEKDANAPSLADLMGELA